MAYRCKTNIQPFLGVYGHQYMSLIVLWECGNGNMRIFFTMWPLAQDIYSNIYGNNGARKIGENIRFTIYSQFNLFFPLFFSNYGHCLRGSNVLASSARVLTRSCVNLGEQNRILGCTRGPPEICFQGSDLCHGTTTLFYLS